MTEIQAAMETELTEVRANVRVGLAEDARLHAEALARLALMRDASLSASVS